MRRLFHRFRQEDLSTLRRLPPGPAPDLARRERISQALERLLAQERTWTAAQLAQALRDSDIYLSARQVRRYLHGLRAGWRRTKRSLRHKQDPERVAKAKEELAGLKRGPKQAS